MRRINVCELAGNIGTSLLSNQNTLGENINAFFVVATDFYPESPLYEVYKSTSL